MMTTTTIVCSACRRLDLRFSDRCLEAKFKQHLQRRLVLASLVHNLLSILGYIQNRITGLNGGVEDLRYPIDDPHAFRQWASCIALAVIPVCDSILIALGHWRGCFKLLDFEVLHTFASALQALMLPFLAAWTAAGLYGQDPLQLWPETDVGGGEGLLLLTIDAMITLICLFVPIRMCLKWIQPVCGVLSYSVCKIGTGSPFPDHVKSSIFVLSALAFGALWGAWNNEQVARHNFVAQGLVQKKSQEIQLRHESNSRILERLSDAVVHLGHDFSIIEPSLRFAALLLNSNKDALSGANFCEYLASEDDRQRFTNALQGRSPTTEPCEAHTRDGIVNITLRDTHGRNFAVYAYHASFFDVDGECGHMVAFSEVQEREAPFTPAIEQAVLPLEVLRNHIANEVESRQLSEISSGSKVSLPLVEGRTAEVLAWVDVASADLTIIGCSAGFTVFGVNAGGTGLAHMIGNGAEALRSELQEATNRIFNGEHVEFEPFKLRLRTTPHSCIEFTTTCRVAQECCSFDDDGAWDGVLCLVFSEVRCHHRRRSQSERFFSLPRLCQAGGITSRCLSL